MDYEEKKQDAVDGEFPEKEMVAEMEISISAVEEIKIEGTTLLDKISKYLLLAVIFLLPVFAFPIYGFPMSASKNFLVLSAVIILGILTLVHWLRKGAISFPKNPIITTALFLGVVYFVASAFSGNFGASFFGLGFETSTSLQILLGVALIFFVPLILRSKKDIFYAIVLLLVSSALNFLMQAIHFAVPSFLPGIFSDQSQNLIGSFVDLGVFFGLVAILSLVALEIFPITKKIFRGVLYAILGVSVFSLLLAPFAGQWIILTVVSLGLLGYFMMYGKEKSDEEKAKPFFGRIKMSASLVVALISFVFIFVGAPINQKLYTVLRLPPTQEVRPSFYGSYLVARGTVAEGAKTAIIGVGPNRFSMQWNKYRPIDINNTPWWGIDFNGGYGVFISSLVATGVVGLLAWVLFMGSILVFGCRSLFKRFRAMDPFARYITASSCFGVLYLWMVLSVNATGIVPLILSFIFTGFFVSALSFSDDFSIAEYEYFKNPKRAFIVNSLLIVVIGLCVAGAYFSFQKYRSYFLYNEAMIFEGKGDMNSAEGSLLTAISLYPNDAYYRALSALDVYRGNQLLSRKDLSGTELSNQWNALLSLSISHANAAIVVDDKNYLNYVSRGNAYASVVPLKIANASEQAYQKAKLDYEMAEKLNPKNPEISLIIAQTALSSEKYTEAKTYIENALQKKNNYVEAMILLSQVDTAMGLPDEAIVDLEKANTFNPGNATILFQIGSAYYKNAEYSKAITALEQSVAVIPNYADAKYFLGLSYSKQGMVNQAIQQFEQIKTLNPDRSDIASIIENLKAGRAPFVTAPTKADAKTAP